MRLLTFLVAMASAAVGGAEPASNQGLPPPGQAVPYGPMIWNGTMVLRIARGPAWDFVTLAPDTHAVRPLRVPGLDEVWDLATHNRTPVALGVKDGSLTLLRLEAARWKRMELPRIWLKSTTRLRLTADEHWLTLVDNMGTAYWRGAGRWRRQEWAFHSPGPVILSIVGNRLFGSYVQDEFGGGLGYVDLTNGTSATLVPLRCSTLATTLTRGPEGQLWAVEGFWLNESFYRGRVRVLRGAKWKTLASTDDVWAQDKRVARERLARLRSMSTCADPANVVFASANWPWRPTPFEGLAFDGQGRPVLLAQVGGLFRLEKRKWRNVTPRWPFEPFKVHWTFLSITGDTAVLGSDGRGLVLWNIRQGQARFISLPKDESAVHAPAGSLPIPPRDTSPPP